MQGRAVIAGGFFECALRRKMNAVASPAVECTVILIVRNSGSRSGENSLARFCDFELRALRQFVSGYVVDLLGVEDGIDPMNVARPVSVGSALTCFLPCTCALPVGSGILHIPKFNLGTFLAS